MEGWGKFFGLININESLNKKWWGKFFGLFDIIENRNKMVLKIIKIIKYQ